MDVSSVSSSAAVSPVDASSFTPQAQPSGSDGGQTYQPPPKPPLPPGQGTRVDQIA